MTSPRSTWRLMTVHAERERDLLVTKQSCKHVSLSHFQEGVNPVVPSPTPQPPQRDAKKGSSAKRTETSNSNKVNNLHEFI